MKAKIKAEYGSSPWLPAKSVVDGWKSCHFGDYFKEKEIIEESEQSLEGGQIKEKPAGTLFGKGNRAVRVVFDSFDNPNQMLQGMEDYIYKYAKLMVFTE